MGDRRTDGGAAVLEDEHVRDVRPAAERGAPLGPQVDDLAARSTPSDQKVASCSAVYSTTSHRSPGIVGQRLTNPRTSYGSGDSSPPTQNGQPVSGRFGRSWRESTMKVR